MALPPRSNLSRKRRNDELSSDALEAYESQSTIKKPKVSFDDSIEVRFVDELGEKSASLVREEVKHALWKYAEGDREEYNQIKSLFKTNPYSEDAPSSNLLRKYLLGLTNSATLLKRSCSDLVHAVLDMQWQGRDDALVATFTRFVGNIVSSQPGYISTILKMLVGNFAHIPSSAGRLPHHPQIDRLAMQSRIHGVLKYLLTVIPAASSALASIISTSFPDLDDSKKAHIEYAKNLLRVTDYAPELKADILDLITEKLLKIDVHVQIDIEDFADEIEDVLVQGGLDPIKDVEEENDDDDSDADSISSDDSVDPEERRIESLKSAVQKMDSLMDVLFTFYTPSFDKGVQSASQSMFNQILSQFRKTILPTYRSRHTQFLLFHFAQQTPEFAMQFAESCIGIITDKAQSSVIRLSAAAYIASFVARGSQVSSDTVLYVFSSLASYLEKLRRANEPNCRGPDLRRYSTYYATVQALIYIFCFRWRDLLNDPDEFDEDEDVKDNNLIWAPGVKEAFQQSIMSKLNPLKICAPEIVEEFARIAHHLQFLYIYPILDSNKRLRLSTFAGSSSLAGSRETALTNLHGERFHQLDAYFPFDPYHLPVSQKWLDKDYNEWKGVPGLHDALPTAAGALEESSEDEAEEEDDIADDGTETPDEDDR